MNKPKPSYADIDPTGGLSLDEASAGKIFFGLSEEDALKLFQENSLFYLSELLWMGPVGFTYYLRPAITYIESEDSQFDSDAVNILCGNIQRKLELHTDILPMCADSIRIFCNYVLKNWDKFEIDDTIYNGLKDRVVELLELTAKTM